MEALLIIVLVGVGIAGLAFIAFAEKIVSRPSESLHEQIRRVARETAEKRIPDLVDRMVKDELKRNPKFRFIKYAQWELMRVDPSLDASLAFQMSKRIIRDFLNDEGVEFGDKRFAWDKHGAIDLVHAYEIDHWETVQ